MPTVLSSPAGADEAIDAVVAWVDGDDPRHRAKLNHHLEQLGRQVATAAPTRFSSIGEIDYCVTSLLKFAPFVRRIHVVTDDQVPPIFAQRPHWSPELRDKLVLVDHRDIFAGHAHCLPTFNARSIETMLYRVPGLAERFVYLNDDFFLIKPVRVEDWFRDGKPVIRGAYRMPIDREVGQRVKRWLRKVLNRPKEPNPLHQRAQAKAAAMAGFTRRYYATHHVPNTMRRSTLERFYAGHPERLRENITQRLRALDQFVPAALANHLEIRAGSACLEADERRLYLEPGRLPKEPLMAALAAAERDPQILFACLQSLDEAEPTVQQEVMAWLDRVIGRIPAAAGAPPAAAHPAS